MPHSPGARPPQRRRRVRRRTALAATVPLLLLTAAAQPPAPLGIGDRLFPYLGNPGYHVTDYDIALDYHRNDAPLDAVTTIDARATERLERFNLDFTRGTVRSVEVNGARAEFVPAGEDLVVTPARPVPRGTPFTVTVRHTSDPRGTKDGGWVTTKDGLVMANQADAAHRVFPGSDHPSEKADFTFRVRAPKGLMVVANGVATGRRTRGAVTTWTYRTRHPMATELAQVSIGRSVLVEATGPHGLRLRSVVPAGERERLAPWTARTAEQVTWLEGRIGRYPFENYGVLIAEATTGFELETQTLSLFEHDLFTKRSFPAWYIESVMVHELAHQWFGDSVTPRAWTDVWLNEGHATWYEAQYAELKGGRKLVDRMRRAYEFSDLMRADGGPPADLRAPAPGKKVSIFRPVVYDGSALVLYALRQKIGARAFDRLERVWVERYADATVSTADFTALASKVAHQDLSAFLHAWLHDPTTPPMPGHPDWKVTRKPA
ncbi:M1 family metallopeptidase [Streptomyces sp. I05A-00742]|uniref:M1 family metallopeptidase n=1 Tax=Streptomyces sp. I05A-00742 TaxID=2732853 RepID=UPI00148909E7|nr:M1 family metallopeptidase [Streptomyces sp. I05A-00742]